MAMCLSTALSAVENGFTVQNGSWFNEFELNADFLIPALSTTIGAKNRNGEMKVRMRTSVAVFFLCFK